MGAMSFNPGSSSAAGGGGGDALGQTRLTFSKNGHRFEFRCDGGQEAILARAVLEFGSRVESPLEAGDAFALARQIEGMCKHSAAPGKPGAESSSSGLLGDGEEGRRKAA